MGRGGSQGFSWVIASAAYEFLYPKLRIYYDMKKKKKKKSKKGPDRRFSSTQVNLLALEAAMPPIGLLIAHKRRMAATTLVCTASPRCNAAAQLPSDFLSPF